MGTTGGVGVVGMLTILFVVLKLTSNVNWSWWWVLAPLWIFAMLYIVVLAVMVSAKRSRPE